jgi:hypothetical protein
MLEAILYLGGSIAAVLFSCLLSRWSRSRLLRVRPDTYTEQQKLDYDAYGWWVIPTVYAVSLLIALLLALFGVSEGEGVVRFVLCLVAPLITGINIFIAMAYEDVRWRAVFKDRRDQNSKR